MTLDFVQSKQIKNVIIALSALGGIVAIMAYIDQKRHNKIKEEIMSIDKEIKELQLSKLKNS